VTYGANAVAVGAAEVAGHTVVTVRARRADLGDGAARELLGLIAGRLA
jgi:hypothetical protein